MFYRFIAVCCLSLPLMAQESVPGFLMRQASGVSVNPSAAPMPMLMTHQGDWMLMLHGNGFLVQTVQHGPHGGDKLFSANWVMGSAERPLFGGELLLRSMLSLEPLTIGRQGYPEPFQSGEGLLDRQHPHDFFMELAAEWATDINGTIGYVYAAPVGDPALGPVAFPHRASAMEMPQATLAHHLEDSTHIASSVVTFGAKRGQYGLAFSGFHGREPDSRNRWDIDGGNIDSWSVRGTWEPTQNISAQVSTGHLTDPEREQPGNVQRTTASVAYSTGDWSSSAIAGWNHGNGSDSAGLTLESVLLFNASNYVTGRLEILRKEEFAHIIKALTAGYTKDLYRTPELLGGAGLNVTVTRSGDDTPVSVFAFVRVRTQEMSSMDHSMHSHAMH